MPTAHASRSAASSLPLAQKAAVDRDERGGEDAFAKQILQKIGNAKARFERVGRFGIAQVVGENAFPYKPGDATQQDSGCDDHGQVGATRKPAPASSPGFRLPCDIPAAAEAEPDS